MKVADYLVNFLAENGVTDVYGIPGGVVLDLLYAFDKNETITPHLSYHEQGAAFEACGYAQHQHKLGVAYATRGPGFTNLITGIADAYSDSLPVMFITAHSGHAVGNVMRYEEEQEMNTVAIVAGITKYAKAVETVDEVCVEINNAYQAAMSGRKGPVLLDFSAGLWNQEIDVCQVAEVKEDVNTVDVVKNILESLKIATRPLFLVGDGVRQSNIVEDFVQLADKMQIPVLSSRCSQDVGAGCEHYFGYVGSHGIRYSNFIFAKADLVIAIGNRLAFPINSKSFTMALQNKKIVRIDIDESEFNKKIPNSEECLCNARTVVREMLNTTFDVQDYSSWLNVCYSLKNELDSYDQNDAIEKICSIFAGLEPGDVICCDVGNNEFWVSRAYVDAGIKNRILYSKSFGVLGCAIPKAIGATHASHMPVICVVGDQGFQLNSQELQMIAQENLPVQIYILNNKSSGMIRSREKIRFGDKYVHTTFQTGYGMPSIEMIARAYGIPYVKYEDYKKQSIDKNIPLIVEVEIDEEVDLYPNLPRGNECQNMSPLLPVEIYEKLNRL